MLGRSSDKCFELPTRPRNPYTLATTPPTDPPPPHQPPPAHGGPRVHRTPHANPAPPPGGPPRHPPQPHPPPGHQEPPPHREPRPVFLDALTATPFARGHRPAHCAPPAAER